MAVDKKLNHYLVQVQEKNLSKPHKCQACKRAGVLRWHGSYQRTLITITQTAIVPIKRLFCVLCRHTFALLPDFILKWHRYAKEIITGALCQLKRRTYDAVANWLMEKAQAEVATLTLYLWRKKFG